MVSGMYWLIKMTTAGSSELCQDQGTVYAGPIHGFLQVGSVNPTASLLTGHS